MKYPFSIDVTKEGKLRCIFPDIPEMGDIVFENHADIADHGHEKFSEVLEKHYRRMGREVPKPTRVHKDEFYLYVHIYLQAKILLWHRLLKVGISASELARRYGCSRQELQRVLDFSRFTGIDKIEQLLLRLDRMFDLSAAPLP